MTTMPAWIRRWRMRVPDRVLGRVSDAGVAADAIELVLCHDFNDHGDLVYEQVALVRLRDGRWAALVGRGFGREAMVPPFESVTVAPSWELLWRFVLEIDDRERLAKQLPEGPRYPLPRGETPDEERFLAVLRERPDAADTRGVYADFLEQSGDLARATVARIPDAPPYRHYKAANLREAPVPGLSHGLDVPMPPEQAAWRALVVDAPIARCCVTERMKEPFRYGTPGYVPVTCETTWRTATVTKDAFIRTCPRRPSLEIGTLNGCDSPIHYCASLQDVLAAGVAHASIVLDPALDPADALTFYDENPNAFNMGDPPSFWSRVRRFFR